MSNVVQLLDAMGRAGLPFPLTHEQWEALLARYPLEPDEYAALSLGDKAALNLMLGGRDKMIGTQYGEEDTPEGEEMPLREDELPEPDGDQPS